MTEDGSGPGLWRIGVSGVLTPVTAALLEGFEVVAMEATTVLLTVVAPPDRCARTIAKLQSFGLEVVDLCWVDLGPRAVP